MALPKYNEVNQIQSIEKLDEEISLLTKNLFNLRMKKATNQSIKPHLFRHTKRRIAQLNFKKSCLLNPQS